MDKEIDIDVRYDAEHFSKACNCTIPGTWVAEVVAPEPLNISVGEGEHYACYGVGETKQKAIDSVTNTIQTYYGVNGYWSETLQKYVTIPEN